MIFLRFFLSIIFLHFVYAKFDAPLPTKENVGEYLTEQYAKSGGYIPEKYDGPVYDDMNVVIANNVDEPFKATDPSLNDTAFEDEPKLFTFDPEEAPLFRGKRQSGFQPSGPVRSASTGAAIVARVDSTSDIVPYDAHVDPDFPAEAPVARGLKNVPEGWNLDKEIDYEFQRGYRKASNGISPSYSGQSQHSGASFNGVGMDSGVGSGGVEGPYIDGGSPLSMGGGNYGGSSYGNSGYGGMSTGYGSSMGSSGYGSMGSSGYGGMGSSGYGSMGSGYGSNYGGMSSGYGGLGNSYGGMSSGYGGLGSGYGSSGLGYSGYGNTGGYGGLGGIGQGYGGLGQGYGGYGGYGSMG